MATGLNPAEVVRVAVTIEPLAAQARNFGVGNIVGPSSIIDTAERKRFYSTLEGVLAEFGSTAPEAQAARVYFSQDPQPALLCISRWAQTATAGLLRGGSLSAAQRQLSNFTGITSGALKITINNAERVVTGVNFSGALNLNGVAAILQAAIRTQASGVSVTWDPIYSRFTVQSNTTGPASTVSYATDNTTGTSIAGLLGLTSDVASTPVPGVAAETLPACIALLADMDSRDYAFLPVSPTPISDADHIAAAQIVEGLAYSHLYGLTIQSTASIDATATSDLGSLLEDLNLKRTFWQFSTTSPYAVCSFFGRASTVDFDAADTTITLKFKQEPGVVAETLTSSQAATLRAKNGNVFVNYSNDTAILQHGTMANGYWFDEVHGLDWLQNEIQTEVYNLLYTSPTKVPQTDAGMDLIKAVIKDCCFRAVNNGLIAPGVWTGPKVGPLKTGDTLPNGFMVYAPPVATQSKADRAARHSVPFQVPVKLAGAVHDVVIAVYANR